MAEYRKGSHMQQEFEHLRKKYWGQQLWARGYLLLNFILLLYQAAGVKPDIGKAYEIRGGQVQYCIIPGPVILMRSAYEPGLVGQARQLVQQSYAVLQEFFCFCGTLVQVMIMTLINSELVQLKLNIGASDGDSTPSEEKRGTPTYRSGSLKKLDKTESQIVKPPVKWAGGKGQLLSQYEMLLPGKIETLVEPFVGGGAVFFRLRPQRAILNDNNKDLINFYIVVRDKMELLLDDLKKHKNTKDYFYEVREQDTASLNDVQRASRFLFLNKTCFNGLFRVNSRGKFNVPFGKYKNPKIVDEQNIRNVSLVLKGVHIICEDFENILKYVRPDMFIYFDPPYHPLSGTAHFTSYTPASFREEDQRRLAAVYKELDKMGCKVMLSNSSTPLIWKLYQGYDITAVSAKRAINCKGNSRGPIAELVVRNYTL